MLRTVASTQPIVIDSTRVLNYDAPHIVQRFAKQYDIPKEEAHRRFLQCLMFLVICAEAPKISHAPSSIIDDAWHSFVLHTKEYQAFCEDYLGRFVHHNPTDAPEKEAYRRTIRAMTARFGVIDRTYWPNHKAADCDSGVCQGYCSDGGSGCNDRS